jgi:alkanesulfonate monooxygenase SsuD/methylene tetrahydromethanopterin reductase-like flavin-dependent oxidoreductase (luciferase family)
MSRVIGRTELTMNPQVGVIFPPWFPPERLRSTALAAEESGVDQLWLWEDCFKEGGVAAASAVLAWTERLKVRIGLMPAPLRNVALTAMEVATLDRLFPGRFQPVVGHGVQDWMAQSGVRSPAPVTLLREYMVALDRLLSGQRVSVAGRFVSLDGVQLDWPPDAGARVFSGGMGEHTLAMLGEVAPGVLVDSGTSPADLRGIIERIYASARAAGRSDLPEIAVYVHAVRGQDPHQRLAAAVGAATDDPDTERGLAGGAAEIADGVLRYELAGAHTVVLRPPEDEPDIEGYVAFVGTEVLPLVDEG